MDGRKTSLDPAMTDARTPETRTPETRTPETRTPARIELRPCAARDIPAITEIYAEAVTHGSASFELTAPGESEMAARHAALVEAGHVYIVATLDGAVAGYAYTSAYRPRPAYGATVENSVYVRPDLHRMGVGRALLSRLIEEAGARGFRQMVAVIGDSANQGSVMLHERLGFRLVGTLRSVGWKHGRWLDTVLMQRALGPGDTILRQPPAAP